MDTLASLNHSVWDCKYHVIFIPKCRRRTLYGELRRPLGEVFRQLALQKESRIARLRIRLTRLPSKHVELAALAARYEALA